MDTRDSQGGDHSTCIIVTSYGPSTTGLCEPPDPDFQAWISGVNDVTTTGVTCSDDEATAEIGAGQGGNVVLTTAGVTLSMTDGSDSDGSLTARRFESEADNISDLAFGVTVQTSGGAVTPITVSPNRYWTITTANLLLYGPVRLGSLVLTHKIQLETNEVHGDVMRSW